MTVANCRCDMDASNNRVIIAVWADGECRASYAIEADALIEMDQFKMEATINKDAAEKCNVRSHVLQIKPFLDVLRTSRPHRTKALRHFLGDTMVTVQTDLADSYVIDYAWGHRLWRDCHFALERECAAAWLSTLGGGFSALGDYSAKFAARALHTSLQQLRLAKMCQDDSGVARGLLFLALALSQLGFDEYAGKLLHKAWNHPTYDSRHKNMCLGVQAKLKYDSKTRRQMNSDQKRKFLLDRNDTWNTIKDLTI